MYDLSMKKLLIIAVLGFTAFSPIAQAESVRGSVTVSYTHLTLPTKA